MKIFMHFPLILATVFIDYYAYCTARDVLKMSLQKSQKPQNILKPSAGRTKLLQHFKDGQDGYNVPIFNFNDIIYVSQIYIGTPPQEFTVQLDTGSGNFWVVDSACGQTGCYEGCTTHGTDWCSVQCDPECCSQSGGTTTTTIDPTAAPEGPISDFWHSETAQEPNSCQNVSKFDSKDSSTYQETNMTFLIEYGLGFAAGIIGQDRVQFGSESNDPEDSLNVCQAYFGQANQKDTQVGPHSGILGLGLMSSNQNVEPLFIQAYKQGLFENPLFSLYLASQGNVEGVSGGVLTLGGVDVDNCAPITDWIPIIPNENGHWEFQVDQITYDGTVVNGTHEAIVDSGTSLVIGPRDEVNGILQHYGVDENGTIPCDRKFGPIIFTIHGNEYRLDEETLLLKIGNGNTCFVGLISSQAFPFWLLGDPFCREFCQIHDVEKKQFALPKAMKEEK